MKTPAYEDSPSEETLTAPLDTDEEIMSRVGELIGRANSRQLWLLFLDDVNVQLPLLIPIEGLPSAPSRDQTERVVANIHDLMLDIGAASVVTVWERYGAPTLTAQDSAWAQSLWETCADEGVHLRAMLLSHRNGVSWIDENEFAAGSAAGAVEGSADQNSAQRTAG